MFQMVKKEHIDRRTVGPSAKEAATRILVAIDESASSHRVVQYVGSLMGRTPDVVITLFHVLKPMPRGLLEHGGSENPAAESQLSVQLHDEQNAWIRKERETERQVLKRACETLIESGFDMSHVMVKYGHEDDIGRNILEEARSGHCDTVVVGRQGTSRIKQIFGGGTTDHVLRDAKGFAIWVVERKRQGLAQLCEALPREEQGWKALELFVSAQYGAALHLCAVDFCAVDAGDKLTECHTR